MIKTRKSRTKSRVWSEPKSLHPNIRAQREAGQALKKSALDREREAMTSEEIDRRLVAKLIECAKAARPLMENDLYGLNVPVKEITPARIKRCVLKAEEQFPELRNRMIQLAA